MSQSLDSLLTHPGIWRASRAETAQVCPQQGNQGLPSGFTVLDRELPNSGWPPAQLMELLLPRVGGGEMPLLTPVLAQLTQAQRWVALVAPPWMPYVPALLRQGVRPEFLMVITPTQSRDVLWSMEQCMGSGICAAVVGWPGCLQTPHIKRLALAAQKGRCLSVLLRDVRIAEEASPAPLRIELGAYGLLDNGQTQLQLRIVKRRSRWPSDWIAVHWPTPVASLRWMAHRQATLPTSSVATPTLGGTSLSIHTSTFNSHIDTPCSDA